jgi:hypothetical protein
VRASAFRRQADSGVVERVLAERVMRSSSLGEHAACRFYRIGDPMTLNST